MLITGRFECAARSAVMHHVDGWIRDAKDGAIRPTGTPTRAAPA
jgi:hypothetical protein